MNFQWIARECNIYSLTNLCDWKCKCNNIWSLEYLFRHIKNKTFNLFHLNLRKSQQSSIKFFGDDFEQINLHVRLRISANTCKFSLYYYLSNVNLRTLHFRCNTFSHPCTHIRLGFFLKLPIVILAYPFGNKVIVHLMKNTFGFYVSCYSRKKAYVKCSVTIGKVHKILHSKTCIWFIFLYFFKIKKNLVDYRSDTV